MDISHDAALTFQNWLLPGVAHGQLSVLRGLGRGR